MPKINILTSDIYNLISAGEVVVSPASLIKELIENSIDAQAHSIKVELVNGGISQIVVQDDGIGIEQSEVEKAFMKHATSKIATREDIFKIKTMGFRGEALYSIALVSNLNMITRSKSEEIGTKIEIEGGEILSKEEINSEVGTRIEVTKLFFNTPARYKFLKTPLKEYREVQILMTSFILAYPNIQFELVVDGKTKLKNRKGDLEAAIFSLYGSDFTMNMLEVNEKFEGYRLEGAIGLPTISKNNRSWQTVFINNRIVESEEIASTINSVYHDFLMRGRFPCFVINLIVPYDEVDVNVSPQKTQVKLHNSSRICNWIYHSIRDLLVDMATNEELQDMEEEAAELVLNELNEHINNAGNDEHLEKIKPKGVSFIKKLEDSENYIERLLSNKKDEPVVYEHKIISARRTEVDDFISNNSPPVEDFDTLQSRSEINVKMLEKIESMKEDAFYTEEFYSKLQDKEKEEDADLFPKYNLSVSQNSINSCGKMPKVGNNISHLYTQSSFLNESNKVIGVLFSTYIIVENKDEFFIIDQHAVHEKFLFDQYMSEIENSEVATQELMMPFKFTVNAVEKDYFLECAESLRKVGIEIQDFGHNALIITQIPTILSDVSLSEFVDEMLSDLTNFSKDRVALKNKIATRACKNAVKAGDTLNQDEIDKILKMVENSTTPLLCPHGRPYVVKMSKNQVEKWFKRSI